MLVFLVSWLRNPYKDNKAEVRVNTISKQETVYMCMSAVVVCFAAFLVNDIYGYISWQKMKSRQRENQ